MTLWHDLVAQLPSLKKKFLKYDDYKLKGIDDIFTEQQLRSSTKYTAAILESSVLLNNGGKFEIVHLPAEAQRSPVYGIGVGFFNDDSIPDLLLGGNLFEVKPEVGRYDASYGTLLLGQGDGKFIPVDNRISGIDLNGQVRDIVPMTTAKDELFLIAKNNDKIQVLRKNTKTKPARLTSLRP